MSEAKRVLLVEDDDDVRSTLAANLELDGFVVVEALNGEHALQILEEGRPDVVLSDVRMTGMTGVDMLVKVKARAPDLPVILSTAFSSEELLRRALLAGVFTVLSKPFEPRLAVRTLRRAASSPGILVLDEAETDASLAAAIRVAGVRVSTALNLADAVSLAGTARVDVALVRGVEPSLCESLRRAVPALSVIAVDKRRVVEPVVLLRAIASARGEANL